MMALFQKESITWIFLLAIICYPTYSFDGKSIWGKRGQQDTATVRSDHPWNIQISPSDGYVIEFSAPQLVPLVIHVQDAHANPPVQTNIAKILRHLVERCKINLVSAWRGADGGFDDSLFDMKDPSLKEKVVRYFLNEARMTRGEYQWLIQHPPEASYLNFQGSGFEYLAPPISLVNFKTHWGEVKDPKNTAVFKCAEHVLNFFRETYPREEYGTERTLTIRLEMLESWIEAPENQQTGILYFERSRAKKLREMYGEDNFEVITQYGRDNSDTMTGGMFYGKGYTGFHNETTQNHLCQFDPKYSGNPYVDYASEAQLLSPFYQNLLDRASKIKADAFAIRDEILGSAEFQSAIDNKSREEIRALYLVEEFKRKERVIPLLAQVEALYSDTILLTEAVLALSKDPKGNEQQLSIAL